MIYRTIALLLVWACSTPALGQHAAELPDETSRQYADKADPSISDEFNADRLDTDKWGRRNTRPSVAPFIKDNSLVVMESESEDSTTTRYLSVKATAKDGPARTAGIVSRASGHFGFYVVKFRYRGLDSPEVVKKKTIWHPSVWFARGTPIQGLKRAAAPNDFWLEIDLMEWETNKHGWSSDAPARILDSKGVRRKVITKGPGLEKAIMKDEVAIHDARWQTVGLEYTPNYLKLWQWKDGRWENYSDRHVSFVEDDLKKPESKDPRNIKWRALGVG